MQQYTAVTSYHYAKEDDLDIKTTTKLRGRGQQEKHMKDQNKPGGGRRFVRSVRDWFGMCWGRRDDESVSERSALMGDGGDEYDVYRDESASESEDSEDEDGDGDEMLMAPEQELNKKKKRAYMPKHAAKSFLKTATRKTKGWREWRG